MKQTLKTLVFILLSLQINHGIAQTCFDQIADTPIPEAPHKLEDESEKRIEFLRNVNCFLGSDLDALDIEIVTQNTYLEVILMLEKTFNQDTISYGKLKELFIDFVSDSSYIKIREMHILTRTFTMLPAIYENWETDKSILLDLGFPEEGLEPFRAYFEEHPNTGKTYQDLFIQFGGSKANQSNLDDE